MKIRTELKAGAMTANHCEALRVRTALKAGALTFNHNETLRANRIAKRSRCAEG